VRERIEYRFRVPSAAVFTLYSYSKALEYHFRVPTAGSLRIKIAAPGYAMEFGTNIHPLGIRLPAVVTLKQYSKALEYEYRVKNAALGTLKRYSILSLTLYLE
jgi:hypothetical protein